MLLFLLADEVTEIQGTANNSIKVMKCKYVSGGTPVVHGFLGTSLVIYHLCDLHLPSSCKSVMLVMF